MLLPEARRLPPRRSILSTVRPWRFRRRVRTTHRLVILSLSLVVHGRFALLILTFGTRILLSRSGHSLALERGSAYYGGPAIATYEAAHKVFVGGKEGRYVTDVESSVIPRRDLIPHCEHLFGSGKKTNLHRERS